MAETNLTEDIRSELKEGMCFVKCRKCGCMKETLENIELYLSSLQIKGSSDLQKISNTG